MRKILIGGVVALVALAVGSSSAQVPDISVKTPAPVPLVVRTEQVKSLPKLVLPDRRALLRALLRADRPMVVKQLAASERVVRFFENPERTWLRAPRQEKCWQVPWQRTCTVARHSYRLHLTLAVAAQHKLAHELPLTNDWRTAVRIAQRVYPGTESWMLLISDREGGWGPWVWWGGSCSNSPCLWHGYHIGSDSTGDTVGGWMQFRFSTFASYWRGAIKDLRARGYTIPDFPDRGGPEQYQAWLDPLGQALTAGYMRYYGKDGCHWCI